MEKEAEIVTHNEIMALKDEALNDAIAVHVMGWEKYRNIHGVEAWLEGGKSVRVLNPGRGLEDYADTFSPATSNDDAFQALEKAVIIQDYDRGFPVMYFERGRWIVAWANGFDGPHYLDVGLDSKTRVVDASLPRAISRVALMITLCEVHVQ